MVGPPASLISSALFRFGTFNVEELLTALHPELFLGKGVLKIRSKFTGEHTCRGAILKVGMGDLL